MIKHDKRDNDRIFLEYQKDTKILNFIKIVGNYQSLDLKCTHKHVQKFCFLYFFTTNLPHTISPFPLNLLFYYFSYIYTLLEHNGNYSWLVASIYPISRNYLRFPKEFPNNYSEQSKNFYTAPHDFQMTRSGGLKMRFLSINKL